MPLDVLAAGSNLYAQLAAHGASNDEVQDAFLTVTTPRIVHWQDSSIDEIVGISACQIVYRVGSSYKLAGFQFVKDAPLQEDILQRMTRNPPVKMLGKDFLQAWLDKDGRIHGIANEQTSSATFVDADMDAHGRVLAVARDDRVPRLYQSLQDLLDSASYTDVKSFPADTPAFSRITAGAAHFLIHAGGSEVYSLGDNRHFQQGHPHPSSWTTCHKLAFFDDFHTNIKSIAAGNLHTLFLTEDGAVYAAGSDANGQCGGFAQQQEPSLVELEEGEDVVQVACGSSHSVLLTDKHKVYVSGSNHVGQLGLGHMEDSSIFGAIPSLPTKPVSNVQAVSWNTFFLSQT